MTNQETVDQIVGLFKEYGDYFSIPQPDNYLVNGARTVVGKVNNEKNLDNCYGRFQLEVTFKVPPPISPVPHCKLYMVNLHLPTVPPPDSLVGVYYIHPSWSVQKIMIGPTLLPPFDMKFLLENQTGRVFQYRWVMFTELQ